MAKTKKKNKGGGGTKKKTKAGKMRSFNNAAASGQESKPKIQNPFEIRVNRSKHDNLGKRLRHEKGVPGISRSKAIEKRKETLLKEYKRRNKSSVLVDKRIGEKIKNMSEEEKIIKRSVFEKQRQYKQKSIFNLPSTDDILTHKGQLLTDIDRYEDPRDESDSDDERLNEEFVSDAHFAGDFLKVKSKPSDEIDEDEGKSRGDIIAELILNSKKRKMEKAKEADENYELVTKLDQEFKSPDFRNLLNFVRKDSAETTDTAALARKEDYDKIVRELHFEAKVGQAANRLKTEEEIEEDELEKSKTIEKEPTPIVNNLRIINSYNIRNYLDLLKMLSVANTLHDDSKRYCPEVVKLLVDIMEAISFPLEKLRFKRRRLEFLRIDNIESDLSEWDDEVMNLEDANETPSCGQVKSLLLQIFDFVNNIIETSPRTKARNTLVYLVMRAQLQILSMKWKDKKFLEELFSRKLSNDIIKPKTHTLEDELPAVVIDRPKMLKLYEPMIEENFDGNTRKKRKRKDLTQEEARLSHKVKKEMKSAVREILKDNAFLAKQQLKEQALKDAERSRKVKELLGSLSNQEGDYRKLKRQK